MWRISKSPITLQLNPKTKFKKRPLKPFQKKISSLFKNGGDSKNIEKSLEILLNSKLSNLILHLEARIEVRGDSYFFRSINEQLLKINRDFKSIIKLVLI
jgi:hypothetical protein